MTPCLKKLLATAKILIPHTGPVTNDKAELCLRLGIEASTNQSSDQLRILVGDRCLNLLVGMQRWLEKEHWPPEAREGLANSDFLLGTADMRIIRALCLQAVTLLLLPLSQLYRDELLRNPLPESGPLKNTLTSFLDIMTTHHPPSPPAGPSTRTPLSHTPIAVSMIKHLPFVAISAVLLAYTPTCRPDVHADLRKQFLGTLNEFPPSTTIPQLNGALAHYEKGKDSRPGTNDGWMCRWLVYMRSHIINTTTAQIGRPGGIKALMGYLLGEAASLRGAASADTVILNIIAKGASAHHAHTPIQDWLPRCIDSLLDIISPLEARQASPLLYIHAACYSIQHVWATQPEYTSFHLRRVLLQPVIHSAKVPSTPSEHIDFSVAQGLRRNITILLAMTQQTPYDPEYLDSLVRPVLVPLFTLMRRYEFRDPNFSHQSREIIGSWVKDVDKEIVVNVIKGIIDAGGKFGEENVASAIAIPDEDSEL